MQNDSLFLSARASTGPPFLCLLPFVWIGLKRREGGCFFLPRKHGKCCACVWWIDDNGSQQLHPPTCFHFFVFSFSLSAPLLWRRAGGRVTRSSGKRSIICVHHLSTALGVLVLQVNKGSVQPELLGRPKERVTLALRLSLLVIVITQSWDEKNKRAREREIEIKGGRASWESSTKGLEAYDGDQSCCLGRLLLRAWWC